MKTVILTTTYSTVRQYEVLVPDDLEVFSVDWSDPSDHGVSNEIEDGYFETDEVVTKVEVL